MNSNLSKIVTHNFSLNKHISYKYYKCFNQRCGYCPFANINSYLKINNFYLPIMCNSNCEPTNIILNYPRNIHSLA